MNIRALFSGFPASEQPLADALLELLEGGDGASLLAVLATYQNDDGGFGHGLEGDIQLPLSNVASTNLAMNLLADVSHPDKNKMIKRIIAYYESVYDPITMAFPMVPKDVDDYPHAVWWNFDSLDAFTYGNPNPEIAGTLMQYRHYVSALDVDAFVTKVIDYIITTMPTTVSMHSLLSSLMMYERVPTTIQAIIKDSLISYVATLVEHDPSQWQSYGLEPYKVFHISQLGRSTYEAVLSRNIALLEDALERGPIQPNWQWYQYEDVFETVKPHWTILLTYDAIKTIHKYKKQ